MCVIYLNHKCAVLYIWISNSGSEIRNFYLHVQKLDKEVLEIEVDQNRIFLPGIRNIPGIRFQVLVPGIYILWEKMGFAAAGPVHLEI